MRLLLDTHVLFWWLKADARLSAKASEAIGAVEAKVYVSAASAWEIAIKHRIGKWPEAEDLATGLEAILLREGFTSLPVTVAHALRSGRLAHAHRAPFDRLIAAQAYLEELTLVTADSDLHGFGIPILW